jgi:hypothetical protein
MSHHCEDDVTGRIRISLCYVYVKNKMMPDSHMVMHFHGSSHRSKVFRLGEF